MVPPPKPVTTRRDTLTSETANEPRRASMLDTVGSGPRSYGLSSACATGMPTTAVPVSSSPVTSAAPALRIRCLMNRPFEIGETTTDRTDDKVALPLGQDILEIDARPPLTRVRP